MKNISMKKALAMLVIALLIVSVSTLCFADVPDPDFISGDAGSAGTGITNVSDMILGIVQIIGVAVAVIMLVVLAIKYLSAAPGEKAEIKKSAFIYVIGALLLFGGVAFLQIIQNAGNELQDATAVVTVNEQKADIEVA